MGIKGQQQASQTWHGTSKVQVVLIQTVALYSMVFEEKRSLVFDVSPEKARPIVYSHFAIDVR